MSRCLTALGGIGANARGAAQGLEQILGLELLRGQFLFPTPFLFPSQVPSRAWRDKTNEDIAASIIGFIRKAAIGDPLVDYDERVNRALKKLLAKRAWTEPQRTWLNRIAKQLKQQKVLDRDAFDEGQFASEGGFSRLNKQFEGQLEMLLGELADEIWTRPA
jgi:type I restriction enzyme R subunit